MVCIMKFYFSSQNVLIQMITDNKYRKLFGTGLLDDNFVLTIAKFSIFIVAVSNRTIFELAIDCYDDY